MTRTIELIPDYHAQKGMGFQQGAYVGGHCRHGVKWTTYAPVATPHTEDDLIRIRDDAIPPSCSLLYHLAGARK